MCLHVPFPCLSVILHVREHGIRRGWLVIYLTESRGFDEESDRGVQLTMWCWRAGYEFFPGLTLLNFVGKMLESRILQASATKTLLC